MQKASNAEMQLHDLPVKTAAICNYFLRRSMRESTASGTIIRAVNLIASLTWLRDIKEAM
jgi:hypothetical protein